jgi:Fe2+ or Zn2+ uptake regulation protein
MWQALIKLVEKLGCMHNMKLVTETYENFHTRQVYVCTKCGKVKKIKL